jgi:hypothetical protein
MLTRRRDRKREVSRWPLLLTLAVVLASVLLPNTAIAWMREHWAWFNQPMLLIESAHSIVNLVHAILFLLLGVATRMALPRWRAGQVWRACVAVAIATEAMQWLVPGRHPRWSDVLVDLVAGMLGWALVRVWGRRAF